MKVDTVWTRLGSVENLTFNASSLASTGWNGAGVGAVEVSQPDSDVLLYRESGTWTPTDGKQLSFTNVYRWTRLAETIRLEHLRFGTDNPVHLFDLGTVGHSHMASIKPHT